LLLRRWESGNPAKAAGFPLSHRLNNNEELSTGAEDVI